ncbi:hypothetical protein [Pedobacter sp. UC225_65]|uniref:hypothetical protein n=1 Tax=Pedobacter sp. UC225_65 TaxID=3350173 RepID=UPI00366E5D5B
MKRNPYLIILLLVGTLFTACKKSDIVQVKDFDRSYQTWLNFKSTSDNSYRYKISTSSWVGSSTETIITIKNGQAIARSYVAKRIDRTTNQVVVYDQWTEDKSNLNSHQSGASALTLDRFYEKAKTDWLLKRKNAKTSFEANNNGMIFLWLC